MLSRGQLLLHVSHSLAVKASTLRDRIDFNDWHGLLAVMINCVVHVC